LISEKTSDIGTAVPSVPRYVYVCFNMIRSSPTTAAAPFKLDCIPNSHDSMAKDNSKQNHGQCR